MNYKEFLNSKIQVAVPSGFECAVKNIRSAEESKNSVIDLF